MKFTKKSLLPLICACMLTTTHAMSAEWIDPTEYKSSPLVGVSAVTIIPVSDFKDVYKSGYGVMLDISNSSRSVRSWKYSFKTGIIQMNPETETDDSYQTGYGNGYIFPLLANIEYRFPLPFWRRIKLAPALSAGMALITATYDDRSGTIKNGIPTGWTAAENSLKTAADPMALGGLSLLYLVNGTDYIFLRGDGGMLYEIEKPMFFASINAGYEKT